MLGPFRLLAFAMIVPYTVAALHFARSVNGGQPLRRATGLTFGVLTACAVVPFCFDALPIAGLYAGMWVAALASFAVTRRDSMRRALLTANTVALSAMLACGLVYFGFMSLANAGGGASAEGEGLGLRCALLAEAFLLASLLLLGLGRILDGAYPASKRADHALQPFLVFSLFGIAYELLDLVPSLLGVQFALMPLFLLDGTVLLAVFCAVFAFVSARLGAEAFRETESLLLERRKLDQEMRLRLNRARAAIDQLTGLATRRIGQRRLDELQDARLPFTVAFLDMDGLKAVNDERGHLAGDEYLSSFAKRLGEAFPEADVVRWGGDEFLVIEGVPDEKGMRARLGELEAGLAAEEHDPPLRFSFGVASSRETENSDSLVRRADAAMYAAKRAKRRAAGGPGAGGAPCC
ncbi:GGDEF domain-containing protein [Arabiibacter massiliensis]|uniref:GGDEF domain-containing protein n=1 Tax=Arabiibacter massiliensis TaxID=1870985 RepID=UPI0009BAAD46|nr:GGDEF domain-containing protein [Arabiibacter massiliensis]